MAGSRSSFILHGRNKLGYKPSPKVYVFTSWWKTIASKPLKRISYSRVQPHVPLNWSYQAKYLTEGPLKGANTICCPTSMHGKRLGLKGWQRLQLMTGSYQNQYVHPNDIWAGIISTLGIYTGLQWKENEVIELVQDMYLYFCANVCWIELLIFVAAFLILLV